VTKISDTTPYNRLNLLKEKKKKMSSMQLFYVLPFFLLMVILNPIHAVDYLVINNATVTLGGAQFGNEIGVQYTEQTLQLASEFIWQTFKQAEYERKYYPEITMVVTSLISWDNKYPRKLYPL
jgi:hypothetical protein